MTPEVLWQPPPDVRRRARIGRYLEHLETHHDLRFDSYNDLWQWSTTDLDRFWRTIWDFTGVEPAPPDGPAVTGAMPAARWFPRASVNYAQHMLRPALDGVAIVARSQTRDPIEVTFEDLRAQVARARTGLRRLGVVRGDRVAAYLPNTPEALVAMLATASLGAVWSSCAPEFGVRAVVDRFGQIEPKILLVVDGYRYGDRVIDRAHEVAELRGALPSLETTVVLPYLDAAVSLPDGAIGWNDLVSDSGPLEFEPVPFEHPLYVLFSSGTTGLPKAIVHGHGGILLEHAKYLALHHDIDVGDRLFWFTTTGWMMWNLLVSGLLVGSTIVLFDGDPAYRDLGALWTMAAETGITSFGASAPYLMACRRAGLDLKSLGDLSRLHTVGSTGAPLPADGFRWVYEQLGPDVVVASISGGTDVCTAFVGSVPLEPVVAGEISCRCLGARVEAFDEVGDSVTDAQGELVLTAPMPSMPVGFWGDEDGKRYRAAYFDSYPGVWRHGDWITITERGTCIISGRSDATLNRGGVRIGTAELYDVVESLPEITDSLVVHLEDSDGGSGELILFVQLAPGVELDDGLRAHIAARLRADLSPRHVPDDVVEVASVPRTLTGKRLEVPVKRILRGASPDDVASRDALTDPTSLDEFASMVR
ncbi:MAG TPA: acetoacetate--CoA ligase [Acidimicrobiales bacterium]|nr:acetoacetate--CoA ligase [Acidimicrobiales bacterium]